MQALLRAAARRPLVRVGALCVGVYVYYYLTRCARRPQLHGKDTPRNAFLMNRVSMLRERFFPSPLFQNTWLQLALYVWYSHRSKRRVQRTPGFYETEKLTLRDGAEVGLEWHRGTASAAVGKGAAAHGTAGAAPDDNGGRGGGAAGVAGPARPPLVVLLNPTLTGSRSDFNMVDLAEAVAASGGIAAVFHRRGHELGLRTPSFHMFGSTDDLQQVIDHIERAVPGCVVALVGYSAGSALTGRMAGDAGQLCGRTRAQVLAAPEFQHNPAARAVLADSAEDSPAWRGEGGRYRSPVITAVSVSPAYSLTDGLKRCEAMLGQRLMQRCKDFWLLEHPEDRELLRAHDPDGFARCTGAASLGDFLEESTAFTEYSDHEEYLRNIDPMGPASHVQCPVLLVNAKDDPVCVDENVDDFGLPFMESTPGHPIIVRPHRGSHVAFFDHAHRSWCTRLVVQWVWACYDYARANPQPFEGPCPAPPASLPAPRAAAAPR